MTSNSPLFPMFKMGNSTSSIPCFTPSSYSYFQANISSEDQEIFDLIAKKVKLEKDLTKKQLEEEIKVLEMKVIGEKV